MTAVTIWGASFTVVQGALDHVPVFRFMFLRFLTATVLLLPIALLRSGSRDTWLRPQVWVLGLALFASFALQTAGLKYTSPSKSAFLTGLSVVLVPFLVWLVIGRRPHKRSWLAVALAAAGLSSLYAGTVDFTFGLGDILSFLCAVGFATHVVLMARIATAADVVGATAVQAIVVTVLSGAFSLFEPATVAQPGGITRALGPILFAGALATALAFGCQVFGQARVGPIQTAVILALEPVAAAAVSVAAGSDSLAVGLVAGAGFLVVAAILSQSDSGDVPITDNVINRTVPFLTKN